MNVAKRGWMIAIFVVTLLLSAFFLFACSALYEEGTGDPLHLEEYPLTDEEVDRYVLGSDAFAEEEVPAADVSATDDDASMDDASSDDPAQTDVTPSDTSSEDGGDAGSDEGGENTDSSDQNDENGEDGSSLVQYGQAVEGGYYPVTYKNSRREWTLFAGMRELGRGTFLENSTLSTEAFVETEVELWGKTNASGEVVPYLYFTTLQGFREVFFRMELGVLQIDLTTEELSLLLPPDPSSQGTESGPASENGGTSQQGGEEQTQTPSVPLPSASAAYDFLSAFPGCVADLEVTLMEEKSETYKFKLLSLSASEAETVRATLLTCVVKYDRQNQDGSRSLHVQKQIGDKMFTFMVSLTVDGNCYEAAFSVSGFAPED